MGLLNQLQARDTVAEHDHSIQQSPQVLHKRAHEKQLLCSSYPCAYQVLLNFNQFDTMFQSREQCASTPTACQLTKSMHLMNRNIIAVEADREVT